ncbi:MAG: hypothetical protein HC939_08575 [Pleurocapsa sp. SU_5_0]|nr:hypothetical protein [Pleurocapsa sp. SU_5_0]
MAGCVVVLTGVCWVILLQGGWLAWISGIMAIAFTTTGMWISGSVAQNWTTASGREHK